MRRLLRLVAVVVGVIALAVILHAAASYPSATKSFSTHLAGQVIASADINAIQDEIVAIENGLRTGLAHNVTPLTDAAYDFGAGAFQWRDLYLSRNAAIGGTLAVTSTSTLTGAATFASADNSFKVGASTETHKGAGLINTDFTPAANTTTGGANDTLFTYTLPASALNANGRVVRVTAYGTFGATANTKSVRLWWNGTGGTNFVLHSSVSNASKWVVVGYIMRTAANAQDLWGFLPMSGAAQDINANYTTAAVTDSNAITIVVTGSSAGAANDVNYKGSIIEFLN